MKNSKWLPNRLSHCTCSLGLANGKASELQKALHWTGRLRPDALSSEDTGRRAPKRGMSARVQNQPCSPRGSTFHAMVSVMAVKIQLSSPRGVRLSFRRPGILFVERDTKRTSTLNTSKGCTAHPFIKLIFCNFSYCQPSRQGSHEDVMTDGDQGESNSCRFSACAHVLHQTSPLPPGNINFADTLPRILGFFVKKITKTTQ